MERISQNRERDAALFEQFQQTPEIRVQDRVEYSLSELGESMRPVINAMREWGPSYQKQFE